MTAVLVEEGPDAGAIWHFGEPNQEQRALALGSAWADLSHRAIVTVTGPDRLSWLHSITTQNLEQLQPAVWTDALILDAQGHITQQFALVDDGATTWLLTEAELAKPLLDFLNRMRFMLRVEVADVSQQYAVLRAPELADAIGGPYAIVPRTELAETTAAFSSVATQVGIWALEAERIAAGRARILFDIDYKSIPNELGLLNKSVHMRKGCYPGQETVAKVFNLGQPPRKLILLHLDGSMATLPPHGTPVEVEGKQVGTIGSSAWHYELGPIALATVRRSVPLDSAILAAGVAGSAELVS